MDRKLFDIFSGWQITCVLVTAIVAPSVLYGAVATQAVSITDPKTGAQSYVDGSRRLSVYDPVAGYANDASNYVDIDGGVPSNTCAVIYTTPPGKALVITAVSGNFYHNDTSKPAGYLVSTTDCATGIKFVNYDDPSTQPIAPINQSLGNGVPFPAGDVRLNNINNSGFIRIHGYLVPAGAIPADSATSASRPRDLPAGRVF